MLDLSKVPVFSQVPVLMLNYRWSHNPPSYWRNLTLNWYWTNTVSYFCLLWRNYSAPYEGLVEVWNGLCGSLALSWRRPLSYRNQSIDLRCKSIDWFLYDNSLRLERVNEVLRFSWYFLSRSAARETTRIYHVYYSQSRFVLLMMKGKFHDCRKKCEICSKLTIKTPERRQWRRSSVFIINFERISHLFLVFLLLTWTSKC